jgi:hypothetical protein
MLGTLLLGRLVIAPLGTSIYGLKKPNIIQVTNGPWFMVLLMLANIYVKKNGLVKPIQLLLQPHLPDREMTSGSSGFAYPALI